MQVPVLLYLSQMEKQPWLYLFLAQSLCQHSCTCAKPQG